MNQSKLVSAIITTYNAEQYIEKTISSVIDQSYKDWELIIIDDCSLDSTWKLLMNFRSKHQNIYIFKNKKKLWSYFFKKFGYF